MGLAVLGDGADDVHAPVAPESARQDGAWPPTLCAGQRAGLAAAGDAAAKPRRRVALRRGRQDSCRSRPGSEAKVTFVVAWCFPNLAARHGNYYATRFADAAAVARYVADNFDRLAGQTRLWHRTWYDSTLPLLAAGPAVLDRPRSWPPRTCQWWANGRFWAWEGVRLLPRHLRPRVELRARHGPALPRTGTLRPRDAGLRPAGRLRSSRPARSASAARTARCGPATARRATVLKGLPRAPDVGRRRLPQAALAARSARPWSS